VAEKSVFSSSIKGTFSFSRNKLNIF
jgi:hypothetical protein